MKKRYILAIALILILCGLGAWVGCAFILWVIWLVIKPTQKEIQTAKDVVQDAKTFKDNIKTLK